MSSEIPLNILMAYPYIKEKEVAFLKEKRRTNGYRLIIDSGAFTAWNTGKEIKLDDYCRFLDAIESLRPFRSVQLDVVGDPGASWANYEMMRKRGYDVMPVFTRGESLERLEEMYSHTDYVMFGGIAFGAGNANYVKWLMERNGDRKIHWLGFANLDFVRKYNPTSVDASSWNSSKRYGGVKLVKPNGQMRTLNRSEFKVRPDTSLMEAMRRQGASWEDIAELRTEAGWTGGDSAAFRISVAGHVLQARAIESACGTRYFFACENAIAAEQVFRYAERLDENKG
jgi:hypothetical protein